MRDSNVRLEELMDVIHERLRAGESVSFFPHGTSMLPMLKDGKDKVVLSPLPEKLKKYHIPLYRRNNGQYVLHRIVKVGETYTMVGDNQYALEKGIRREQMIGVVTGVIRDGKEYSLDTLSYKLYCRFWHCSRPARYVWRIVKSKARRLVKK